tara:strand:+ start:1425 stop:1712 length:288 start_codon:yes stop_codon:yes gene_type:complete
MPGYRANFDDNFKLYFWRGDCNSARDYIKRYLANTNRDNSDQDLPELFIDVGTEDLPDYRKIRSTSKQKIEQISFPSLWPSSDLSHNSSHYPRDT